MAVVSKCEHGWLIDHEAYLWEVYKSTLIGQDASILESGLITTVNSDKAGVTNFSFKSDFFEIHHPFMTEQQFEKYSRKATGPGEQAEMSGRVSIRTSAQTDKPLVVATFLS